MWQGTTVVDCDSHVMEPEWLWGEYLDRGFRETRIRVERDPDDGDKLILGDRPSRLIRRLGGVSPDGQQGITDWNRLPTEGHFIPYRESCTKASWDPRARVRWLDDNGIDSTLLFPSLGLIWPREVDPGSMFAIAHYRAYNRWIREMTSSEPARLLPVAMLGVSDVVPVDQQLEHAISIGFRHVMMPLGMTELRSLDRFWAKAQDAGTIVHLHKVALPHFLEAHDPMGLDAPSAGPLFRHAIQITPGQLCLTAIIDAGLLDRFPGLRFAFHECNAGWVPSWLDRMTESYETLSDGQTEIPASEPSKYLYDMDAFFFSIGLEERIENMPEELWPRLLMATDYPHPGTPESPASAWEEHLENTSPELRSALLGDNALRLLGA